MGLTDGLSPADISALVGNNDGLGGNGGAWWIIILFLFIFGRGGFGGDSSSQNTQSVYEGYVLQNDFSQLSNKLENIGNGICDSTFALNNTITSGFANSNSAVSNGFYQNTINDIQNANAVMQNINGIGQQLSQCCCDNRAAISDLKYSMATDACTLNTNISTSTRDIIDSQTASTRAILDAIQSNKIEALKERIEAQNQQINALNLAASQQAQNAYLISQLKATTTTTA